MNLSIKLGILTYTEKHRKTYDVLCLLKAFGYKNVTVYAKPFHYEKRFHPLIEHRPPSYNIDTELLCKNLAFDYVKIEEYGDICASEDTIMLICGAGILPHCFINAYKVVNSHPGFIPNERGLDAFKWAIIEKEPIGVTTHLVEDLVDAGQIISRVKIPVYENDSFHTVALRVYEKEVEMLVNSISSLISGTPLLYIDGGNYIVHKRMPSQVEKRLYDAFEEYKKCGISQ